MSKTLDELGHRLQLDFVGVGEFRRSVAGWSHCKTVPYAIAAQACEGRYEVQCQGRNAVLENGGIFLVPPHTPVEIMHRDGNRGVMWARWIHLRFRFHETTDYLSLFELPLQMPRTMGLKLGRLIGQALKKQEATDPISALERHELAIQALGLICRVSKLRDDAPLLCQRWNRLELVLHYIRLNLAKPLALPALARLAGLSEPQFHVVFKEAMGMSPMRYVRGQRLEAASRELIVTDRRIGEIGEAFGFPDPFHFSHAFKAHFGATPRTYRQQPSAYYGQRSIREEEQR